MASRSRSKHSGSFSARRSPRLGETSDPTAKGEPNPAKKLKKTSSKKPETAFFVGDPVTDEEARSRWPWRYQIPNQSRSQERKGRSQDSNNSDEDDVLILNVKCHYYQAEVGKCIFNLGDCVYVKGEGKQNYIGKILEFFKTTDDEDYFRVQWFYRAEDTVMKEEAESHDKRRLFYSDMMNDNLLDCIVSKLKVVQVSPNVNLKSNSIPRCDFYYDMKYEVDYSTFCTMTSDCSNSTTHVSKINNLSNNKPVFEGLASNKPCKTELTLLDIYSGCGGMSTGLCLGFKLSGLDLVTKWALDINKYACESLKLNHPETQIRNESAEDFLDLLKEWDKLCKQYVVKNDVETPKSKVLRSTEKDQHSKTDKLLPGEFEVARLLDVCYGDPSNTGKRGLKFQVRWLGYGPSEDTWEPLECLSGCQDRIRDFVLKGNKEKILPHPGDVDVICGGPPCQGISGSNRFRNVDNPLEDERNQQIVVFMDIVNFLKPKYVLMENVTDILKFAKGCLGRYALSRLVHMKYQTRLGLMAAGCYGLPQFRLRVFLWGAHPNERLPQFPLPSHDVILRYGAPVEFERNIVAYDEGQSPILEKALVLSDAISDLPPVTNDEISEHMSYKDPPETEFQKYIRAPKHEMMCLATNGPLKKEKALLYDHKPLPLKEDDYSRVCRIPHRKGANFRDLPGVFVGADNVVRKDPSTEIILPSGKPLVPDYAINFRDGISRRPFGRLWWDETVATLFTRPDPHNQAILHPEQDRVLTLREAARLQGFPDYYRFCGGMEDRYCQVGNAVAVPVARALGYALGVAVLKLNGEKPLMTLPHKFSHSTTTHLLQSSTFFPQPCLRRQSDEVESTEHLIEIYDGKATEAAIKADHKRSSLRRQSMRFKSEEPVAIEVVSEEIEPPLVTSHTTDVKLLESEQDKRKDDAEERTVRVVVPRIGNIEIPPEDGNTWRKYGQKEIIDSRFPRSYYRCTHQKLYQCPAKKQVQRLDDEPYTFEVSYQGNHTCHMSPTAPISATTGPAKRRRF